MTLHKVNVVAKDGAGSSIPNGIQQQDTSGTGAGPNVPFVTILDSAGAEALGLATDSKASQTDSTPVSMISLNKQMSFYLQTISNSTVSPGTAAVLNSIPVTIASDQGTTVGPLAVTEVPQTTAGLTTFTQIINATPATNAGAGLVKGSAGKVYKIEVYNSSTTGCYVKFYNSSTTATAGSGTPVWRTFAPAGGGASTYEPCGLTFGTGIAIVTTGLLPDADTTALVNSTTVSVNIGYK